MARAVVWRWLAGVVVLATVGSSASAVRRLSSPTPAANGFFGAAVALSGSTAAVGAPLEPVGTTTGGQPILGAVHLFDAATAGLVRSITNPSPEAGFSSGLGFGAALAAANGRLLVGAPFDDPTGTSPVSGAVYVYDAAGSQLAVLRPETGGSSEFGAALAAVNDWVAVGAPSFDSGGTQAGAVYVYDLPAGGARLALAAAAPVEGSRFGAAIAANATAIVVGAPGSGSVPGAVHVFDAATGALRRTLTSPAPTLGERFGVAVGLVGDDVVVGAYDAQFLGSARRFDGTTGALEQTLSSPSGTAADRVLFGCGVGTLGSDVVIGSLRGPLLYSGTTGAVLGRLGLEQGTVAFGFGSDLRCPLATAGAGVLVGTPFATTAGNSGAAFLGTREDFAGVSTCTGGDPALCEATDVTVETTAPGKPPVVRVTLPAITVKGARYDVSGTLDTQGATGTGVTLAAKSVGVSLTARRTGRPAKGRATAIRLKLNRRGKALLKASGSLDLVVRAQVKSKGTVLLDLVRRLLLKRS